MLLASLRAEPRSRTRQTRWPKKQNPGAGVVQREGITPPKNAADLARMMGEAFALTLAGRMSPSVGASLAYQASTLMKCLEIADHEPRVAALEELKRELSELSTASLPTMQARNPTDEEFDRALESEYGKVSTGTE